MFASSNLRGAAVIIKIPTELLWERRDGIGGCVFTVHLKPVIW